MEEELKIDLYFCGDIHGELRAFVWEVVNRRNITNANVIILGDFGIGFDRGFDNLYKRVEKKLDKANVTIYALRGNHDCPDYFINTENYNYPRLKFLEDHKIYEICGRKLYIIGGANSTDITWRLKENQKLASAGSDRRCWWKGEDIKRVQQKDLPGRVDMILSHDAPLSFEPVAIRFNETPIDQYEIILDGRRYLDTVLNTVNADYWFYGHYHQSLTGTFGKLLYRCLNIMEIYQAPEPIDHNIQGEINEDGTIN